MACPDCSNELEWVVSRMLRYHRALLDIVHKGEGAATIPSPCCGDCYETECDEDCPVRIARAALNMKQRHEEEEIRNA